MELTKHPVWCSVVGAETLTSFRERIMPPIFLPLVVHDDIKSEIDLSEKLLLHSYFEYEFIDLALINIVFTLEKLMKIRYKEVTGTPTGRMRFANLIDWFYKEGYFEVWNDYAIHQLRDIRNTKVHDEKKNLGGLVYLYKVKTAIYLINDLYEDVSLRARRKIRMTEMEMRFKTLLESGGIFEFENQRLIIFQVDVAFVNNKSSTDIISLVIWPIFDPRPYREDKHFVPTNLFVHVTGMQFNGDAFTAIDNSTGQFIKITTISDLVNKNKLRQWQKDLRELPDYETVMYLLTLPGNDYFYKCLSTLYKTECVG